MEIARQWWNSLSPDTQQFLAEQYYPENSFGALALSNEDIYNICISEISQDLSSL